jgi:MFS family permease
MSRTSAHAAAAAPPWYRTINAEQWRVLAAAKLGWMLDALDFMLYTMALNQLRIYFTFDDATAGFLGTATLVMSGVGGLIFGWVADRFGRTRALMGTIVVFSLASLGAATSQSVLQLLFWRTVLGIGMGGEWASGAVLVSETWPAHLRNKAISIVQSGWAIGYILAAVFAALILGSSRFGNEGWRWLFLVGLVPALATLWIRRNVREPQSWIARAAARKPRVNPFPVIFGRQLLARTLLIIALGGAVQFAYFGLFFWLPPYLARPVAQGGAGMGVVGSLQWIVHRRPARPPPHVRVVHDRRRRHRAGVRKARRDEPARAARAEPAARLLRPRLLQHVRRVPRGAVSARDPRDGSRHELQLGPDARSVRAVHDRRARQLARRRARTRAERHVGVLPARGRAGLHTAGSQRADARLSARRSPSR